MSAQLQSTTMIRYALMLSTAIAAGVSNIHSARSETQGALGPTSTGSTDIYLLIVQQARFIAPQSFFMVAKPFPNLNSLPPNAFGESAPIALRATTQQDFDLRDPKAQHWLTDQLRENGETSFSVCLPKGQGELALLDSSRYSTVDGQPLRVSFSKSSNGGATSSDKCPGGLNTTIRISMTTEIDATSAAQTNTQDLTEISAQISLVIVPR